MAYGTRYVVQLPPGTIERFLAYGYKTYGDELYIGGVAKRGSQNLNQDLAMM